MSNNMLENVTKLSQHSYESLNALYEINVKIASQIAEQQVAFANLHMGYVASQINLISTAKDYKAVIEAQNKLISETAEKAQGIARNTMDIVNESKDELSTWVKKGVEETVAVVPFAKTA